MPSSPNYVRDYEQEAATESPERKKQRAERVAARRIYEKATGRKIPPGHDLDHKKPLSKGGSNKPSNWRVVSSHKNRSYPRTSSGAMKGKKG